MDCSPSGSSVHRISQTKVLERVAISFSRRLSPPRDWTWVSYIAGRFFIIWATGETYITEGYVPSLNLVPHGRLEFSYLDQVLYTFRGQWGIWAPLYFLLWLMGGILYQASEGFAPSSECMFRSQLWNLSGGWKSRSQSVNISVQSCRDSTQCEEVSRTHSIISKAMIMVVLLRKSNPESAGKM